MVSEHVRARPNLGDRKATDRAKPTLRERKDMPKLTEGLIRECANKLKEIFNGIEVVGSTVYYKGQEIIKRVWLSGAGSVSCDPAIFIRAYGGDLMLLEIEGEIFGAFKEVETQLLTYAIASIVAHEIVGDAFIYADNQKVIVEIGDARCNWLTLEFPYISPNMDISQYRVRVRQGGIIVGEFAPTEFEALRRVVALCLL
jgi:hypothetical protein